MELLSPSSIPHRLSFGKTFFRPTFSSSILDRNYKRIHANKERDIINERNEAFRNLGKARGRRVDDRELDRGGLDLSGRDKDLVNTN